MPDGKHRAKVAPSRSGQDDLSLEQTVSDPSPAVAEAAASHPGLSEELALRLLTRRDLHPRAYEALAKNKAITKHRKVMVALVAHVKTPRHVSLPIARHLYNFELMQIALTPAVPADVKRAVEDALTARLATISAGERITLAKRGSTRIAAALLLDAEKQVMEAAMQNPFLTEPYVAQAIKSEAASAAFIDRVSHHAKWSLRQDVRIELLKNDKTPLARVLYFAQSMPVRDLREVLGASKLSENVKQYLNKELELRATRRAAGRA